MKGFAETAAGAGSTLFSGVFGRREGGGNGGNGGRNGDGEDDEP
jgi:hypothetical protein